MAGMLPAGATRGMGMRPRHRFSLLHLDEGEDYVNDFVGLCRPPGGALPGHHGGRGVLETAPALVPKGLARVTLLPNWKKMLKRERSGEPRRESFGFCKTFHVMDG